MLEIPTRMLALDVAALSKPRKYVFYLASNIKCLIS